VDFCFDRLSMPAATPEERAAAVQYVLASGAWTGSDSQLLTKTAGVVHLLTGSAEYQLA
jgi:hypothetical protein